MIHQRHALTGLIEIESHPPGKELTLVLWPNTEREAFLHLRGDQARQFVSMAREARDRPGPAEQQEDRYAGRTPFIMADGSKVYAKDPADDPAPTLDPQA